MITICMSYYNRKPQLKNTLFSFLQSKRFNDIFLVIVDDASDPEHELFDADIPFPHLLIKYKKEQKWWYNCGYANNVALQNIPKETDVILLQNPENYHIGDVIDRASSVPDNKYLAFACYYMLPHSKLTGPIHSNNHAEYLKEGWVCHSKYKPNYLNYTCALTPATLQKIGLFDSRFYHGVCFDDNEWVERIEWLGIEREMCDDPYTKHQFHERVFMDKYVQLEDINRSIINEIRAERNK